MRKTEEICLASSKLITFIDLAGHPKYMKTTVFGLTGQHPDITMLVVSAACGAGKRRVLIIFNHGYVQYFHSILSNKSMFYGLTL